VLAKYICAEDPNTSKGGESIDRGIGTENASPQRVPKSWTTERDNDGKKIGRNKLQRQNKT
jgi:hypothetical protein